LLRRRGDVFGVLFQFAHHLAQTRLHAAGRRHQAGGVAGIDLDVGGQVALGDFLDHGLGFVGLGAERNRYGTNDPQRDAHGQRQRDHHQRNRHGARSLVPFRRGFPGLVHQLALELDQRVDALAVLHGRLAEVCRDVSTRLIRLAFLHQLDDLVLVGDEAFPAVEDLLHHFLPLRLVQRRFQRLPGFADAGAACQDAILRLLPGLLRLGEHHVARADADLVHSGKTLLKQANLRPLVADDILDGCVHRCQAADPDHGHQDHQQDYHAKAEGQAFGDRQFSEHVFLLRASCKTSHLNGIDCKLSGWHSV